MKIIKIWNDNPSEKQLDEISEELKSGKIVIIPSDTLYGICCDALNAKAIENICRIKGINPEKTNLSIVCSDISMAAEYARIDNADFKLLKQYTPGPYTFLFKSASTLPRAFKNRKVVGIRIPDNQTMLGIVKTLGHPILTTSIQYPDDDHAINPGLIAEHYANQADVMVEGEDGDTTPSTIIDCMQSEPVVIRQGKGEVDF